MRRLSRSSTSSCTDSWTSSREPAQQTCPWLKKMPLTIPSTAWSRGASSKTTLAALPPSSRVSRLRVPATVRAIWRPTARRAGERDLVDVGVLDQGLAGGTGAGDDVDHARGQVGLLADLGEQQRGERRRLGRLEHHGVARRQRRRDLPRQHHQREVPRDDLAGDAERPGHCWPEARRARACPPSRRSGRSTPRPAAGRRRGTPGSACRCRALSATASSRERSCTIRAIR